MKAKQLCEYKKSDEFDIHSMAKCPVCGSKSELWLFSEDFKNGPIDKVVMCTNGESFNESSGILNEGCLLYMPPRDFYRGRIKDAVEYWNKYSVALIAMRLKNDQD